ncbi:MAG: hypothetical protein E7056_01815 [Lentisphaerae bacterium]|nr:hypothetical protein [Lentisphaerota bacterium]
MAGIIEKIAKNDVALLQPSGAITDGQYDLDVITGVKAFVLESVKQGYNEFGQVIYGKVFLVAPLPKTPVVPGYIRTADGTTYSVASVKPYRNMAGTLLGYRIAVAGGE